MKTITSKSGKYALLLIFCGGVLLAEGLTAGLTQAQQAPESQPLAQVPQSGTFFLFSAGLLGLSSPPYPCNPYPSDWNIPVYLMENGNYLIGDSPEDVADIISVSRPASARAGQTRAGINDLPPLLGLPGSGTNAGTVQVTLPTLDTNGLWLELLPGLSQYNSNTNYSTILVHNTWQDGEYMLQTSTSPAPWLWDYAGSAIAVSNTLPFVGSLQQDQEDSRFYRVVNISPIAKPDFFLVNQNSENNELDILKNDYLYGDDYFAVSQVTQSVNGTNEYEIEDCAYLKSFLINYTPVINFYGVDYFEYSITNYFSGKGTANVTVFVNKSGNYSPTANSPITLVLQTNIYTASFNALTNVTDPDNDTICLFTVTQPKYGKVTNDNLGNITYTRNPHFYGDDSFTYVVTDEKGGFLQDEVFVEQIENENNRELPVQWLLHYGMSPTYTNTFCDPDNDGLSNLAEFVLGTNPLEPRNSLNMEWIEEDDWIGGEVQIPLIGINPQIATPSISLLLNGIQQDTILYQDLDGVWILNWDTRYVNNGNYNIQAVLSYSSDYLNYKECGLVKSVNIANPMKFDSLCDFYTSALFLKTTLAVNLAYCVVELQDNYGNYLGTNESVITNGVLNLCYNIPDEEEDLDPVRFERMRMDIWVNTLERLPNGTLIQTTNEYSESKWFSKENIIPNKQNFSVAWGWDAYGTSFVEKRNNLMQDAVINILAPVYLPGYTLLPIGRNPSQASTSFRFDTNNDKDVLLKALGQSSHFFWFGHCGDMQLYGDSDKTKAHLLAADVKEKLRNFGYPAKKTSTKRNRHPYKLVVLNGCNSYGQHWADAFGIDFKNDTNMVASVAGYNAIYREPRAFVGWKETIDVPTSFGDFFDQHVEYTAALQALWVGWMSNDSIEECVEEFASRAAEDGFDGLDSYVISGCSDLRLED